MSEVKVFGHKAPDTDTVCSAIVNAWLLSEAKKIPAKAYRLGELNRETQFVLKKARVEVPELLERLEDGEQVAIVDTNNADELIDLSNAELRGIVDHHKLSGNIATDYPINVTIRTYGSTASVLYAIAKKMGVKEYPKGIATLMLCSIISDTLLFRSPTTTPFDKNVAEELSEQLKINMEELAAEMFAAKSDLTGMNARDLLLLDSKVFELQGKKCRVAVLETTAPQNALEMAEELKTAMGELAYEEGLDEVFFFTIDILNEEATVIVSTNSAMEMIEKSFDVTLEDDRVVLPGIISRKKQIVPKLS